MSYSQIKDAICTWKRGSLPPFSCLLFLQFHYLSILSYKVDEKRGEQGINCLGKMNSTLPAAQ